MDISPEMLVFLNEKPAVDEFKRRIRKSCIEFKDEYLPQLRRNSLLVINS